MVFVVQENGTGSVESEWKLVQSNLSNTDIEGTEQSVCIREVSVL